MVVLSLGTTKISEMMFFSYVCKGGSGSGQSVYSGTSESMYLES